MADDKTAAEHAARAYPRGENFDKRVGFIAGAAWQAERSAVRRVTPNREQVARWLYENSDVSTPLTNDEGEITGPRPWEFLSEGSMEHYRAKAALLLASGVLGIPADPVSDSRKVSDILAVQRTADRETLLELLNSAHHAPMETHDQDGACTVCPVPLYECGPDEIVNAVLAVLVPASREPGVPIDEHDNQVRAETLEAAADELAEHYLVPGGIVQQVQAVYDMGAKVANAHGAVPWLRARAAEYRKKASV